ncbi:MAG: dihydrofolate reductase [Terrimicrobiaceae bacterium]|nr:dihydrofolate reductase [Terrimicrobiaceae bacterium]
MIAIAAMALNRAIGHEGRIPWHLPKDLQFFKRTTLGHVVVMGRKTFDSLGRPLPGRENIVLSRHPLDVPGVRRAASPDEIAEPADGRKLFVIGGAEIYRALLPRCEELLLTVVKLTPPADTFLPEFESEFELAEVLETDGDREVRRYVRRAG